MCIGVFGFSPLDEVWGGIGLLDFNLPDPFVSRGNRPLLNVTSMVALRSRVYGAPGHHRWGMESAVHSGPFDYQRQANMHTRGSGEDVAGYGTG